MRKFLKNAGLPIGVFALAIAGAFATNAIKSNTMTFSTDQYYQDTDEYSCIQVLEPLNCAPENVGDICTWKDANDVIHQVFGMEDNPNTCTIVLRKES